MKKVSTAAFLVVLHGQMLGFRVHWSELFNIDEYALRRFRDTSQRLRPLTPGRRPKNKSTFPQPQCSHNLY